MAIQLVVVTPEGEAFSDSVEQVVLPGAVGEFGVLESHERFLSPLQLGPMQIQASGGSQWAALSDGFAEVDGARVIVMVDSCALQSEIDAEAVAQAKHDAENELGELSDDHASEGERLRLEALIARYELQLDVAGR